MKLINLSSALLIVLLLFACKKDHDGNVPEDTTGTLLTKVNYYYGQLDTAGMGPMFSDSLYYNDEHQLLKVITSKYGGETILYQFSYDSNGLLKGMDAIGDAQPSFYLQHYILHYGINNRIDSLTLLDSAANSFYRVVPKLTYNAEGKVEHLTTVLLPEESSDVVWNMAYSRSRNGTLDSFSNQLVDGVIQNPKKVVHLSGAVSVTTTALKQLELPYMLLLASRQDATLIRTNTVNLFLQQMLNPLDFVFRDGPITYYNSEPGAIITHKHLGTFNADGTLSTYSYREGPQKVPAEKFYMKFAYITQ